MSIETHNECIKLLQEQRQLEIQVKDYKRKLHLSITDSLNSELTFYKKGELENELILIVESLAECKHEYFKKLMFMVENIDFEE